MLPDMRKRTILCALALTLYLSPLPAARQATAPPARKALAPSAKQQPAQSSTAGWTQWGGPHRNFMPDSKGLASAWPASGPKKLWSRALGEGHSAIAVDGGRLYTMYRPLAAGGA